MLKSSNLDNYEKAGFLQNYRFISETVNQPKYYNGKNSKSRKLRLEFDNLPSETIQ